MAWVLPAASSCRPRRVCFDHTVHNAARLEQVWHADFVSYRLKHQTDFGVGYITGF